MLDTGFMAALIRRLEAAAGGVLLAALVLLIVVLPLGWPVKLACLAAVSAVLGLWYRRMVLWVTRSADGLSSFASDDPLARLGGERWRT